MQSCSPLLPTRSAPPLRLTSLFTPSKNSDSMSTSSSPKWSQKTITLRAPSRGCHLVTPKVSLFMARSISFRFPFFPVSSILCSIESRTMLLIRCIVLIWIGFETLIIIIILIRCVLKWNRLLRRLRVICLVSSAGWRICSVSGVSFFVIRWGFEMDDWFEVVICMFLRCAVQHTSASITINENYDSDVRDDTETFLNKIVPEVS